MSSLYWMETLKLTARRRWLAVIPGFILTALLNLSALHSSQSNHQFALNVWDGVFGTLGGWLYFRFVFLLLFVFLVADSVIEDTTSNWVWLTLSRSSSRIGWWTAKVASLFAAGLVYFTLGTAIIFLISLTRLPYATSLSEYATGLSTYGQGLGTMAFPEGTSPLLLCVRFVLYSGLASGIFALIPVTVSLLVRKAYVTFLIPFVWVFLSHLWQTNQLLFRIDLVPRLFYGLYFHSQVGDPVSLPVSLLYLLSVGIGFYLLGAYVVQRTDF